MPVGMATATASAVPAITSVSVRMAWVQRPSDPMKTRPRADPRASFQPDVFHAAAATTSRMTHQGSHSRKFSSPTSGFSRTRPSQSKNGPPVATSQSTPRSTQSARGSL